MLRYDLRSIPSILIKLMTHWAGHVISARMVILDKEERYREWGIKEAAWEIPWQGYSHSRVALTIDYINKVTFRSYLYNEADL